MANCKACKTGKCRIVSSRCQNMTDGCFDVCTNPICGCPNELSLQAPLIYDEVGINLCTSFDVDVDISTTYPTAVSACAQILDLTYTYGTDNVIITRISGRPNCYLVTLSNLTANFAITLYDSSCTALGTIFASAVYLPSDTTSSTYDVETNPSSVSLEIFAPYGVSYNAATSGNPTIALNNIGFMSTDNTVTQGLNIYAIPKVLGLDVTTDTLTVGVTLILQSLYFAGYCVQSAGKINTPKGSLIPSEDSECLNFVAGELLNLAIRPLNLGAPACEGNLKQDCSESCCGCENAETGLL